VFHNVKIVGNGDIPLSHVALIDQSMSNAIVFIKSNIIGILLGAVRQISEQIHQDLRLSRENLALIVSNILIARVTIKLILTSVSFGCTISTRSGMSKNIRSFMKTEANQFT